MDELHEWMDGWMEEWCEFVSQWILLSSH